MRAWRQDTGLNIHFIDYCFFGFLEIKLKLEFFVAIFCENKKRRQRTLTSPCLQTNTQTHKYKQNDGPNELAKQKQVWQWANPISGSKPFLTPHYKQSQKGT
ncbi:hypothetical protein ILYODFUR_037072 [Ilyodon furcidens]|uniref:Uncharacterized protein n=1 Tax=Ilyodon furcidens TaxID=33524 RepID=A0ABV0U0V8_9TELE